MLNLHSYTSTVDIKCSNPVCHISVAVTFDTKLAPPSFGGSDDIEMMNFLFANYETLRYFNHMKICKWHKVLSKHPDEPKPSYRHYCSNECRDIGVNIYPEVKETA